MIFSLDFSSPFLWLFVTLVLAGIALFLTYMIKKNNKDALYVCLTVSVILIGIVTLYTRASASQTKVSTLEAVTTLIEKENLNQSAIASQETQMAVTFKEAGLESEFTLPAGWTYSKITNSTFPAFMPPEVRGSDQKTTPGLDQFLFYDQNHKQVGGISFFSTESQAESSFDGCGRGWDIQSSEAMSGNKEYFPTPLTWVMDRSTYVTNDKFTSVVTESCGFAYIYWVPGELISDSPNLLGFYGKKPIRELSIHDVDMNRDDFVQLVNNIAKSVRIKN